MAGRVLRHPRKGEILWKRVPGGRALHAVSHESYPNAVCGVGPEDPERWKHGWSGPWMGLQERFRRRHQKCAKMTGPGRINFWPADYEEEEE